MKKFSNVVEMVREANQQELSDLQKSYREYFGAKLKKFNVESPADLNDEQKKEFFNEIKKDWEKGSGAKPAGKKDVEEHGVKEGEDAAKKMADDIKGDELKDEAVKDEENSGKDTNESATNESLLLAGGLVVLTVLGIRGIRNIVENMRIEKNLNKEIEPAKLKETMQKIWDETNPYINPSEKGKAKAWLDECLAKVDSGEMKTLKDFQTSLNAQVFEGEWIENSDDVNEAKINEKDIKNKEDFAKFVKDKLKKVHGDDFDEEKAQKVIDGLAKDAEKSGDWGAAVGKLNKA